MITKLLLRFSMMGLILLVLFIAGMTVAVHGQGVRKIDIDIEVTPHTSLVTVGAPLTMTVNIQNNSIVSDCTLSDYAVSLVQTSPVTPAFRFVSPSTLQGPENDFIFTLIATHPTTANFQALLWVEYRCPDGKTVILRPQLSQLIKVRLPQREVEPQQQRHQVYLPLIQSGRDVELLAADLD